MKRHRDELKIKWNKAGYRHARTFGGCQSANQPADKK